MRPVIDFMYRNPQLDQLRLKISDRLVVNQDFDIEPRSIDMTDHLDEPGLNPAPIQTVYAM